MYWSDDIVRASKYWDRIQDLISGKDSGSRELWGHLLDSHDAVAFSAVFDFFLRSRPNARFGDSSVSLDELEEALLHWLRMYGTSFTEVVPLNGEETFLRTLLEATGELGNRASDLELIDQLLVTDSADWSLELGLWAKAQIVPRLSLTTSEARSIQPLLKSAFAKGIYPFDIGQAYLSLPLKEPAHDVIDACLSGRFEAEDQVRMIKCAAIYGSFEAHEILVLRYPQLAKHWNSLRLTTERRDALKYPILELEEMLHEYKAILKGKEAILRGNSGTRSFWGHIFDSDHWEEERLLVIHDVLNGSEAIPSVKVNMIRKVFDHMNADQVWITCRWIVEKIDSDAFAEKCANLAQKFFPNWRNFVSTYKNPPTIVARLYGENYGSI